MDTSILLISAGAILVVGGIIYMAFEALWGKRLSGPTRTVGGQARGTLEPRPQGLGFLGLTRNWPGMALLVVGAVLLLFGAAL
jgi:uncharacterized protein YjeT (DUF2065 family)